MKLEQLEAKNSDQPSQQQQQQLEAPENETID
jgi:hypothetical protein